MACKEQKAQLPSAIISWPGYGIWFFWQLGILQYLEKTFDLSSCTMVGSSAGALLSVLAACNVKPQIALDLAHQLCLDHRVFQRPLGLVGVWGGIVKQWLEELLPWDAAEKCSGGHVRIVLTTLPYLQRKVVTDFEDRDDLIQCALASAHLPYILDWRLYATWRGQRCVDGSMLYILTRRCPALRPTTSSSSSSSHLLLFDPLSDWNLLNPFKILRCISLCGKESAQQMLNQGVEHAKRLHAAGVFAALIHRQLHELWQQQQSHPQQHDQRQPLHHQQQQQQQQQDVGDVSALYGVDAAAGVDVSYASAAAPGVKCSSGSSSRSKHASAADAERLVDCHTNIQGDAFLAASGVQQAAGVTKHQPCSSPSVVSLVANSQMDQ